MPDNPAPASAPTPAPTADAEWFPKWFTQFLNDRQTRKPSAHTMKAYRQDFVAIAILMTDGNPARLTVADITKDSMRQAFAAYARDHEAGATRPRGCPSHLTYRSTCNGRYRPEPQGRRVSEAVPGAAFSARVFEFCSGLVDLVVRVRRDGGGGHRLAVAGELFVGLADAVGNAAFREKIWVTSP